MNRKKKKRRNRMNNNNFCTTYNFDTEVDPAMGIDMYEYYAKKRKEYQTIVSLIEAIERQNGSPKAER